MQDVTPSSVQIFCVPLPPTIIIPSHPGYKLISFARAEARELTLASISPKVESWAYSVSTAILSGVAGSSCMQLGLSNM